MRKGFDPDDDFSSLNNEQEERKSKNKSRMTWLKCQDSLLKELVEEKGITDWKKIAHEMNDAYPNSKFTFKRCWSRWTNSLNPALNKTKLADSELLLLIAHHSECKNSWFQIAKLFPGRNTNILRNTFYSLVRRTLRGIEDLRRPLPDFSGVFFIQSLYTAIYLMEVLKLEKMALPDCYVAPVYICELVKLSRITFEKCKKYIKLLQNKLKNVFSSKDNIIGISELGFEPLTKKFFEHLMKVIKDSVSITEGLKPEQELDILAKAFDLSSIPHNNSDSLILPNHIAAEPQNPLLPRFDNQRAVQSPIEAFHSLFLSHPIKRFHIPPPTVMPHLCTPTCRLFPHYSIANSSQFYYAFPNRNNTEISSQQSVFPKWPQSQPNQSSFQLDYHSKS